MSIAVRVSKLISFRGMLTQHGITGTRSKPGEYQKAKVWLVSERLLGYVLDYKGSYSVDESGGAINELIQNPGGIGS
jgi:hypothetical protein